MSAFASLGSGSRGNATCVRMGQALLLVDCGFSLRQAETRLGRLGVHPADIDAILVTHEHSDHASGVPALAARYGIPLYATHGTLKSFVPDALAGVSIGETIRGDRAFDLQGVRVTPVTVPHDAREPVQFVFRHAGRQIGVISDLGCVTPHVVDHYRGCHGLMLESNHDLQMLMRGGYPAHLKRRIAGDLGHLSNSQAREFLAAVANPELRVVIGHVSAQNNHPDLLQQSFGEWLGRVRSLDYATQQGGAAWTSVGADANDANYAADGNDTGDAADAMPTTLPMPTMPAMPTTLPMPTMPTMPTMANDANDANDAGEARGSPISALQLPASDCPAGQLADGNNLQSVE